jgi:hypothetical protein
MNYSQCPLFGAEISLIEAAAQMHDGGSHHLHSMTFRGQIPDISTITAMLCLHASCLDSSAPGAVACWVSPSRQVRSPGFIVLLCADKSGWEG